jgi:CheY-like chemotaxis protein
MSASTEDDEARPSLARAPFFVEERLEEALELAHARAGRPIELCLEIHPDVPELVSGAGEHLRDAVLAALLDRMRSTEGARVCVQATCSAHGADEVRLEVSIDDAPALALDASVMVGPPRARPSELANRRAWVLASGCVRATVGLLTRIGLQATAVDDASIGAAFASGAPDVVVVDLAHDHAGELASEADVRSRWGLGALPLVVATEAPFAIEPHSAATSISRPVRRTRLVSALRMVLAPLRAPTPSSVASEVAGLRVLVVDDQPLNRSVIAAKLQKLGVRVDTASHGLDAVEACRAASHDLVLMDLQMPVMDGLEAARLILAQGPTPPRIVALTASTFERDRVECQRVGMRGLLTKPVSEADLAEQLELTLKASARRARQR